MADSALREPTDREHAIVVGGGIAGLLAARVLAEHFQRVTLVDRDTLPSTPQPRRGVPQGRHTHGLSVAGHRILDQLFPGISEELVTAGAVRGDVARDCRWFFEGGCLARSASGLEGLLMSRPLLENMLRERTLSLKNVEIRQDFKVEGLTASTDGGRITGIRRSGERLSADLVVDASGRGSHTPKWLEALGYQKAPEERVEIDLAYTTRCFHRRREDLGGDLAAVIPPAPGKRGGAMLAQEGDQWTVTLLAHFGSPAPADLEGFVEFAKSLPAPYIYEVIREAEPVSEPASARFPATVRRRYEKLQRFPEGFLVFGDAIASINPSYAQGMSIAALEAVALADALVEGRRRLAPSFFARAARVVEMAWVAAVGSDLRMPETVGARIAGGRLINWYITKLLKAAHRDSVLANAFHSVSQLLAPPPSVMKPQIALRVLWAELCSSPRNSRLRYQLDA